MQVEIWNLFIGLVLEYLRIFFEVLFLNESLIYPSLHLHGI